MASFTHPNKFSSIASSIYNILYLKSFLKKGSQPSAQINILLMHNLLRRFLSLAVSSFPKYILSVIKLYEG